MRLGKDLGKNLVAIGNRYLQEVSYLREFINFAWEKTTKMADKTITTTFSELEPKDKKQTRRALEALGSLIDKKGKRSTITLSGKPAVAFQTMFLSHLQIVKSTAFLGEMALSYILAMQEAFIKDYINEILIFRPEMMKSGNELKYEQVIGHESMDKLLAYLAELEIDRIGYKDIDGVQKYFQEKFNLDLKAFKTWHILREASFRRNVTVHNKGITNTVYCKKTGFKKVGKKLESDRKYLNSVLDSVDSCIRFVHQGTITKLKVRTSSDLLSESRLMSSRLRRFPEKQANHKSTSNNVKVIIKGS